MQLPTNIGRFRIEGLLGIGGMGEVYRAFDPTLQRPVALKTVRRGTERADSLKRLYREAQACARLQHPNIVTVHEAGELDGLVYIAMELLPGESLDVVLARGDLTFQTRLRLMAQILDALAHAHAAGVIHRDVKPSNVQLLPAGAIKLFDFGIARLANVGALTTTGTVMGSLHYCAPEQLRGGAVDHRSDIYSVGATAYEMLSGRRPFQSDDESAETVLAKVLTEQPGPIGSAWTGRFPAIEEIVFRAMAKSPEERYATALAMRDAIEAFLVRHHDAIARAQRELELGAGKTIANVVPAGGIALPSSLRRESPDSRQKSTPPQQTKAVWTHDGRHAPMTPRRGSVGVLVAASITAALSMTAWALWNAASREASRDHAESVASPPKESSSTALAQTTDYFSAIQSGNVAAVKSALASGNDTNASDPSNGITALMVAALKGHAEIVNMLLAAGAKVNARNSVGTTALLYAVPTNSLTVVRALVNAGADVDVTAGNGRNAFSYLSSADGDGVAILDILVGGAITSPPLWSTISREADRVLSAAKKAEQDALVLRIDSTLLKQVGTTDPQAEAKLRAQLEAAKKEQRLLAALSKFTQARMRADQAAQRMSTRPSVANAAILRADLGTLGAVGTELTTGDFWTDRVSEALRRPLVTSLAEIRRLERRLGYSASWGERAAAAATLGFQINRWSFLARHADPPPERRAALAASAQEIERAASALGVRFALSAPTAISQLSLNQDQRLIAVDKINDAWSDTVRTSLAIERLLLIPFLVADGLGLASASAQRLAVTEGSTTTASYAAEVATLLGTTRTYLGWEEINAPSSLRDELDRITASFTSTSPRDWRRVDLQIDEWMRALRNHLRRFPGV